MDLLSGIPPKFYFPLRLWPLVRKYRSFLFFKLFKLVAITKRSRRYILPRAFFNIRTLGHAPQTVNFASPLSKFLIPEKLSLKKNFTRLAGYKIKSMWPVTDTQKLTLSGPGGAKLAPPPPGFFYVTFFR